MAARIHLNDQFTLCPPLTNTIRERFTSSKARSGSSSSGVHKRLQGERPPLSKPAFLDRIAQFEIRSTSLSRKPPSISTPRGVRTQQSERIPASSETASPRKSRLVESNAVIARNLAMQRHVPARKMSPAEVTHRPDATMYTLGKVRLRRKNGESGEPRVERESDSHFPAESRKGTATTRVMWSLREDSKDKPVIILNWEGVLGQWYRPGYSEPFELFLRQGWDQGVKILMQMFAIALLTDLGMIRRNKVLALCASKGIVFDAVYKKRKSDGTSFLLDYSQVYSDFRLQENPKPALVVSSVGLEPECLQHRQGISLLREDSVSRRRRFLCNCSPAGCSPPLCLLVPNLLLGTTCARMDLIAKIIGEWIHFDVHITRSALDFREIYTLPEKYSLKKVAIPTDLLSSYREELQGLDQSYTRSSDGTVTQALFLVLTGVGNPPGTAQVSCEQTRPPKSSERRLERKLSTKSLI